MSKNISGKADYTYTETPNPHILDLADQFYDAGKILSGNFSGTIIPEVINYAFAIELYLKSLNSFSKIANRSDDGWGLVTAKAAPTPPKVNGHDLLELLEAIEKKNKALIAEIEINFQKSPLIKNFTCFKDVLNKYRLAFLDFRYIYEEPGKMEELDLTEIKNTATVMHYSVRQIQINHHTYFISTQN